MLSHLIPEVDKVVRFDAEERPADGTTGRQVGPIVLETAYVR